jgi:hypothetical protein
MHRYSSNSNSSRTASRATEFSSYENRVLNAQTPLPITETEEITVNNVRGIFANKKEVNAWRGEVPIEQYQYHNDPQPEVIRKRIGRQTLNQVNEIKVLKPCDVKPAGDIIVEQLADKRHGPAPPVHVVVPGRKTFAKEPITVHEIAPQPPSEIPEKRITISGKMLPPPPRKVIIETLADEPERPQDVKVERWLPFPERKRRVIFKPAPPAPCAVNPRNVNIIWEAGCTELKTELKFTGVECANPAEYNARNNVKQSSELPDFARQFKAPEGGIWANDKTYGVPELIGDVHALKLINLEAEGLGEYRAQVESFSS